MRKIRLALRMFGSMLLSLAVVGAMAQPALASNKDAVCAGAGLVGGSANCDVPADQPNVDSALEKGMRLFSAIVGIIALVMFMVGGLKYITSQGDPAQTNSAKNTLIYAGVGLVVVALSQVFVNFVLERFTK